MATHHPEAIQSPSIAGTQPEQKAKYKDIAQVFGEMPDMAIPSESQREARINTGSLCLYEVLDAVIEESIVIEQGTAIALNQSTDGLLLFMRRAPRVAQLIEVRSSRQEWGRTMKVFDVRWTRTVKVEWFDNLYVVGCRRMFGLCDSLSFEPAVFMNVSDAVVDVFSNGQAIDGIAAHSICTSH